MAVDVAALPRIEKINTYKEYQRREGIPAHAGFGIEDVKTVELGAWARREGRGAFIDLDVNGGINDAYVCEIPAGGHLAPQRQMYEEMIYIVSGNGSTSVWNDTGRKLTFEWKAGSLFCIPLNANHQHFNGSGQHAARFLAVTSAPVVMNLYHNLDFIFNNPYTFEDRFSAQDDYFDGQGKLHWDRVLETNFVPDVNTVELYQWKERGAGGSNVRFELGHNTMAAHVSQFPLGTYKKGHRHGPGYHVVMLNGSGYSLMWPGGATEMTEVNWKVGSLFVPPGLWWHQHFVTGNEPARYLAIRWGGNKWKLAQYLDNQGVDKDVSQGGNQIEYEDQDPKIHRMYLERCAANGVPVKMDAFKVRV